jgi:hypothetical protein
VCGGGEGRIAWAGPDEFWTIADQRPGQALPPGPEEEHLGSKLRSISLCHFLDGQVVGSYAMPLDEAGSYSKMNAAACYGPSDCWFAGGTFHLHWNGGTVTVVPEPEDHAAIDMTVFGGTLYESVQVGGSLLPCEVPSHPAVIHEIAHEGESFSCGEFESPFGEVAITSEEPVTHKQQLLPRYGSGGPASLQGFDLATDGGPLGAGGTQIWAAANPSMTVLHGVLEHGEIRWAQILPAADEAPVLAEMELSGSGTQLVAEGETEYGIEDAIAPEPGSTSAWLSLRDDERRGAVVARIDAEGALSEPEQPLLLPAASEEIGYRGEAGPIVCPAAHDCWLATAAESEVEDGWLFHLSDGAPIARDTDPFFDGEDGVITYRPPDDGIPVLYPVLPPIDDSLINQQAEAEHPPPATAGASAGVSPVRTASRPLLAHVKSSLIHGRTLEISFTLTARARVSLVGRRKHRVVATTKTESLKPGRHQLSLRLNPSAWPTSIQFHATPLEATSVIPPEASGGKPQSPLAADSVETP